MEDLKEKWKGLRDNYRRCIQKHQLKQRSGAGSSKLPACKYFEQLEFLRDFVSNEESDGNINIEFAQRASLNINSEIVEVERNGNALVEKKVTPPKKKRKVEPYRKPMSGKSKQTREDISTTDMMIKMRKRY